VAGASVIAGSGAMATGGSAANGGENSGAMPGAGTGGSGQPAGDGGEPPLGSAGEDAGTGGAGEPPLQPVCGNGKLEAGEECDDAGATCEDGCNADCVVVCGDFGQGTVKSDDHHCYKGYDEATFEGAQQDCVARGAHLVTISSEAENDIAQSFVASSKFIGGFEDVALMDDSAGTYEWVTGEPFTYQNWDEDDEQPDRDGTRCANGGPSNLQCYEHCARMTGDGSWSDQRCDLEDGYVCEWEPAGS
jgi:cysteine-rich repeat protein